jgi:hypothetical protein
VALKAVEFGSSGNHDVFIFIAIGQPLIPYLNFRKVKAASFCTGSTGGDHTHSAAIPEKGTVDLPGPKAWSHTPNMLKMAINYSLHCCFCARIMRSRGGIPSHKVILHQGEQLSQDA